MFDSRERLKLTASALRVTVSAPDPVRQAALAATVAAAGHHVVSLEEAELALVEGPSGLTVPQLLLSPDTDAMPSASVLPPGAGLAQIDAALRAVAAGLVVRAPTRTPELHHEPGLTPREAEVLACLGDGASNKVVARRLGISQHTVKFHVEAIFTKLGVTSRSEAVAKALRTGLIGL